MNKTTRTAILILAICCAAYILSMFHRVCPAVISLDLGRDLGLDNGGMSMMSAVTLLSYGLMQLPSGLLADRMGGKRALILLMLITAAGVFWFVGCGSYFGAVGSRFVTGIGLSVTVPCMVILSGAFPATSFARASSVFLCCGGLGSILAAGPLAAASASFGWRSSIGAAGIATLVLTALVFVFISDAQSDPANAKANAGAPKNKAKQPAETKKDSALAGIVTVLKMPSFRPIGIWGLSIMGIYFTMFSLWWGPYLMQGCGLSKSDAGIALTAGAFLAMASQPIVGWLSDTVFKSRKMPVVIATAFGAAVGAVMLFFSGFGKPQATLLICAFVFGTITTSSLLYAMLRESVPLRLMGTASGLMGMLPPLWGVLMQKLYGLLLDIFGADTDPAGAFRTASVIVFANCLLGLVASLKMKETFGQSAE